MDIKAVWKQCAFDKAKNTKISTLLKFKLKLALNPKFNIKVLYYKSRCIHVRVFVRI
jgi:hypothetical protein